MGMLNGHYTPRLNSFVEKRNIVFFLPSERNLPAPVARCSVAVSSHGDSWVDTIARRYSSFAVWTTPTKWIYDARTTAARNRGILGAKKTAIGDTATPVYPRYFVDLCINKHNANICKVSIITYLKSEPNQIFRPNYSGCTYQLLTNRPMYTKLYKRPVFLRRFCSYFSEAFRVTKPLDHLLRLGSGTSESNSVTIAPLFPE